MSRNSQLALLGGEPARSQLRPSFPRFTDRAKQRVLELLDSGQMVGFGKQHPLIREAEEAISDWHAVRHCLTSSSGHGALHACLIGLQITDGQEVITSPYSWGASVSCVLHNNAIPVFCDVDPETGLIDPETIADRITPRTRAVLVPHIYGQPANMTRICQVAEEHGLAVIEDGSQAHGARHAGRLVGGFGDAAGFSCMGAKLLATSEAGYLVTDRDDVYWNAILSCQHAGGSEAPGRSSEPGFPDAYHQHVDSLLYTYRMGTVNAALVIEQLAKLEDELEARRRNLAELRRRMAGIGSVSIPTYEEADAPALHMVTMNFDEQHAGVSRDTYLAALRAEGLRAFVYVQTPLHRVPRLSPQTTAPRVMWTENLRRHGIDYSELELPGVDEKIARSIELNWNYIGEDPEAMAGIASVFEKLEEHLDELRSHEASEGVPALP